MKHHAPQPDLPGTEEVFNLAGQIVRQPEAPKPELPDNTREFPGLRGTFYIHEMPERKEKP
jgi:hypothetical protein